MSGANAAHTLPPGDRDDPGHPVDLAPQPGVHGPGRKPELPTLIVIKAWMEQQQLALADLLLAEKQGDLALLEAAALRLADACSINILITAKQLRREIQQAHAAARQAQPEET